MQFLHAVCLLDVNVYKGEHLRTKGKEKGVLREKKGKVNTPIETPGDPGSGRKTPFNQRGRESLERTPCHLKGGNHLEKSQAKKGVKVGGLGIGEEKRPRKLMKIHRKQKKEGIKGGINQKVQF